MSIPEDSQRLRAKIVKSSHSHQENLSSDAVLKEFVVRSKDDTVEEIMSCNEILDHIQNQDDQDQIEWCFKHTTSHKSYLTRN